MHGIQLGSRLVLITALLLAACGRSAPAQKVLGGTDASPVLATFEGSYDPATGQLTIRTTPTGDPSALYAYPIYQDGVPNSGPDNTLELVTESVPGQVTDGCSPGVDSFDGVIRLRSFFTNQTLNDAYIEIQTITSGHQACNSVGSPPTGLGNTNGLWSYGTLGTRSSGSNSQTATWKFRFATSEAFTFQGRVMGSLSARTTSGPEFDWTPSSIVMPASTFQDVATTTAHLKWNGSTWVESRGTGITVSPVGSPFSQPVGLWNPAAAYAYGFWTTTYFTANASAIDTTGDFTVCAKFRPGALPGDGGAHKVIVAKGKPEPSNDTATGWALMEMNNEYCFHYRTSADTGRGDVMSYVVPEASAPQNYTYDYMCGGRVGTTLHVGAHGRSVGIDATESGTFSNALTLSIGAYPDGTNYLNDGGVYEVIFDSRGATQSVMNEIVGAAEGRKLFASASATYLANAVDGTSVTGYDGGTYTIPIYGTAPLPSDGTGLLAPTTSTTRVNYANPLAEDTSAGGFCVGAEVTSSGPWASVTGGVVDFAGGNGFTLWPFFFSSGYGTLTAATPSDWGTAAWNAGTRHTFKACVAAGTPGTLSLYTDGNAVGSDSANRATISNMSNLTLIIGAGGYPLTDLSGARIGRVFACPSAVAASCN